MEQKAMDAEPYALEFDPNKTALLIIDMQRDFVLPGGFGEALGNDVTPLQATVAPTRRVLDAARRLRDDDHPHPGGPPARSHRLPTQQARSGPRQDADR